MADNTDHEDNFKQYNERYEKGITELYEEKELKIKWKKEILENASIQEYFQKFNPYSIDTFLMFYLSEKYLAYKFADNYEQMVEEKSSRWIDKAHHHLKIILHKKLFDLQCLWRAEQVTVEGIATSYDFQIWKDNILNCPYIEPITKDEIMMYQQYLLTTDIDYRYTDDMYEMQNYNDFKENYLGNDDDGLQLPDWYEFHNLHTGNSSLLLLPDIRGEKEEFYLNLCRKEEQKDSPPIEPYVPDERPMLCTSDLEATRFFVTTFEDEQTRKKYANFKEINRADKYDSIGLEELIMDMAGEDEYIPIEAHYDFREALFKAYNTFNLKKITEHLPIAHEQYLFNRQMELTVGEEDNFYQRLIEQYREMILHGRELNGEERNLDF